MKILYMLVRGFSLFVRHCILPNPFACFGNSAIAINLIIEPVICAAAYGLVGLAYRSGKCPALGSFLYLVFYALFIGMLAFMGIFKFVWWWNLIVIAFWIAIVVPIVEFGRWLSGETR